MSGKFGKKTGFLPFMSLMTVLCLTVAFPGCIISGISTPPDDLIMPEWHLIHYLGTDKKSVDPLPGTSITLDFDKGGKFSGSAGCNRFSGFYSVEGELITVKSLSSTEMYCSDPPGVTGQERQFLSLLSNSTRYNINDRYLVLSYYDEERLLVFERD